VYQSLYSCSVQWSLLCGFNGGIKGLTYIQVILRPH